MPMVFGLKNSPKGPPNKSEKRCELGDLQTLFLYLDRDKNLCQARSVIFQAKLKPHSGSHVIDHPQQRALYDDCESFEYATVLPGETRRLPDGHFRERALQYIFVDEEPVSVRTIPSEVGQGASESYGEHLLRFLNDSTGLDVPPDKGATSDWGRIVWDMIENVAKEVTSRKLIRNSGLRGLLDHFNHFEDHETFTIDTTNGENLRHDEGFGVQLIIVWDPGLGDQSEIATEAPLVTLPKELFRLADHYLYLQPAATGHAARLNDLADKMAALLERSPISRHELATAAKRQKDEGLIAGIARSIAKNPLYSDIGPLIKLANATQQEHAHSLLLEAFKAVLSEDKFGKAEREEIDSLVAAYLNNASGEMAEKVRALSIQITKERERVREWDTFAGLHQSRPHKPIQYSAPKQQQQKSTM
jgi:hypothetical protein